MNFSDLARNAYLLCGSLSKKGYMRWFHSFCATEPKTGEKRIFFIEYLIMNPSLGCAKPIFGQGGRGGRKKVRPSYLAIKAGAFAGDQGSPAVSLHQFYPLTELKVAFLPFVLQFGGNFYSEQHISGSVNVSLSEAAHKFRMTDVGSMGWDLKVHKSIACHTGRLASPLHCAVNAMDTFWHAEGIKAQFHGTVTLNGSVYDVSPEDSCGYADKHWGSRFPSPLLQLASCRLISERTHRELTHSAFAADGCCPRFLWFHQKRRLLLQLTYEGEDFEFNFSPSDRHCKWHAKRTNRRLIWQIVAQNREALIKATLSCLPEQTIPFKYEDPSGRRLSKIRATGEGFGKILLYRKIQKEPEQNGSNAPERETERELIDVLTVENALCIFSASCFRSPDRPPSHYPPQN